MQWLNMIVDEVVKQHPEGEILIESGSSPSGTYHLGHLRELVTCDAILLECQRRGREARHVQFVDDLDNLRKIPVNVPKEYEQYLGQPICDIPAPDGSKQSYANYFLQTLIDACDALSIDVEYVHAYQKYREGWYVPAIERALQRIPAIRQALETVSGRQLEDSWSPIQVLEGKWLKKRPFVGLDTDMKTIQYQDSEGNTQTVGYGDGKVKLDWRLDWPGRWWLQKVLVEPSGRDHMTKGSSYDTGVAIMRDVYEAEPPYPVAYDFINMAGDTKKMSASKGTGLDAVEGATIMPPEVVRYFILRAAPLKRLYFDPINGLVQIMDEFAAFAAKADKSESEKQLWYICTRNDAFPRTVSRVPFSHLVASYQAALKDPEKTLAIIQRTEYAEVAKDDAEIIRRELKFIDAWLEKRAPEDVKFALKNDVDDSDFTEQETVFFNLLAEKIEHAPDDADGAWFHNAIYECKDTSGLEPKTMFAALYRLIIGKTHGPRAGWFLSILPRDWLVKRLRLEGSSEIANQPNVSSASKDHKKITASAELTNDIHFSIDQAVLEQFPQANIGYAVVNLPGALHEPAMNPIDMALATLVTHGVVAENLTSQPEIAAWREAYGTFGVKPSKYLSSAEALAKRALKGNPARVSPLVDAYNAVSLKFLIPMGAMDLEKVTGDITIRFGKDGETASLLGMEEPVEVTPQQVVYADQKQIITWLWNHRDAAATAVTEISRSVVFFADSLLGPELAEQAIDELVGTLKAEGATILAQGIVG